MLNANLHLNAIADEYNASVGLSPMRQHYVSVDADYSIRTANAYESLEHENVNAATAYAALNAELLAQYNMLIAHGYVMDANQIDPYATSEDMCNAARTRTLQVFASADPAHRYMSAEENTLFRFVHDLFGHAASGYSFGPRGEFNAALHHA